VRWPGVSPAGRRADDFLYNIDLAPTLCDLLGVPAPSEWDGASFKARMEGKPGPGREFLVWDCGLYTAQRAVRTRTHLMIRTYDCEQYRQFEPVELYDMVHDPFQTANIAGQSPEIVRACSEHLVTWEQDQMRKSRWAVDPLSEVLRERKGG
jgi:arylsulfatase A-like enzyme